MARIIQDHPDFVVVRYTNYKGETADHLIHPRPNNPLHFGTTKYHPEQQWLLEAYNFHKAEWRTFAMTGFHSWRPASEADFEYGGPQSGRI